jgi:hypothetical protein
VIFLVATKISKGTEKIMKPVGVVGPYSSAEPFAINRGRKMLNLDGADHVYQVKANGTAEARSKIEKKIKERS